MNQKLPMHKYRRVRNEQSEKTAENVLRLKALPRPFIYAAYAGKLLYDGKHDYVILNATGPATFKAIQTVEFLRHRVKGLHATYEIESTVFEDKYEPKEEGLDPVTLSRSVPTIAAKLTLTKGDELKNHRGYMAPLAEEKLLDEQRFKNEITEHFNKPRGEGEKRDEERSRKPRGYRGHRGGQRRGRKDYRDEDRGERRDERIEERKPRQDSRNNRDEDRDNIRERRGNRGHRGYRGDRGDRDDRNKSRGYGNRRYTNDREDRDHSDRRNYDREDRDYRGRRNYDREDRGNGERRNPDNEFRGRGRGRGGYRNNRGERGGHRD